MKEATRKRQTSVRLTAKQQAALKHISKAEGVPVSEIIRAAVVREVTKRMNVKPT